VSSSPPDGQDRPQLWIIAGANGSGKTSAYDRVLLQAPSGSIWIINPDELSKRIHQHEGLPLDPLANFTAVKRMETWLYASVKTYRTVGVETVLSTSKYRNLVKCAKDHGFRIRLIYVFLKTPQLNIDRVAVRVAKGGHNVETAKIIKRRERSFRQLSWFFVAADEVDLFDNSGVQHQIVISKREDEITVQAKSSAS